VQNWEITFALVLALSLVRSPCSPPSLALKAGPFVCYLALTSFTKFVAIKFYSICTNCFKTNCISCHYSTSRPHLIAIALLFGLCSLFRNSACFLQLLKSDHHHSVDVTRCIFVALTLFYFAEVMGTVLILVNGW